MKGESQLYFQSQEEITPIVDYIPVETQEMTQPQRWRLKDNLDISRQKLTPQPHSLLNIQSKIYRLKTESIAGEFDKKTTSIMQGYSINTIPSNEISINTLKQRLKDNMTTYQIQKGGSQISNLKFYSNANSNYLLGNETKQRLRANSIKQQTIHLMRQRSKLLKTIDRSLQINKERQAREKSRVKESRRQKKQLLHEILDKLESNKFKKEVELVKSNCNENEVALAKESIFNKKAKKWVQAKNALKEALNTSSIGILSSHNEENSTIHPNQQRNINMGQSFQNPKPITLIPQQMKKESSVGYFPFPTKEHIGNQIFTFNDIQSGNANIHRHIKNVSIAISQNGSKQQIQESQTMDCVLCKVIGKRCSFH